MENQYIDREALRNTLYDEDAVTMEGVKIINTFPAADVVEIEALEAWLYRIALNNIGVQARDISDVCEVIISRLNGLRTFAKERRNK